MEWNFWNIIELTFYIMGFVYVMYYLSGAYNIAIPNQIDREFQNQPRNRLQGRYIPLVDDKKNEWFIYDRVKRKRVDENKDR